MIEAGENLAFGAKSRAEIAVYRRSVDDLDGNLGGVLTVGTFSQINRAGASVPEHGSQSIGADDLANQTLAPISARCVQCCTESVSQRAGRLTRVALEKLEKLFAQIRVAGGFAIDECVTLGGR